MGGGSSHGGGCLIGGAVVMVFHGGGLGVVDSYIYFWGDLWRFLIQF